MRTNVRAAAQKAYTHEGAPAVIHLTAEQRLRRSVLANLLFEKEFYEDGTSIAERIEQAAAEVHPETLAALAVEAREDFNLRHVPLLLLCVLVKQARGVSLAAKTIARVIQRADEIPELLALYWARNGKDAPLSAQLKKGLAAAYHKFDAYGLAKYDRDGVVKMRDPMRLVHPRPRNEAESLLFKQVIERNLPTPNTWEVNLSACGSDKDAKRKVWVDLLENAGGKGGIGYFALIRNLRNMADVGVPAGTIQQAILARKGGAHRVLPFRFVAAARAAPQFEPFLDKALQANIQESPPLSGMTIVLVDVSGSMDYKLSAKSDLTRMDAAATLASVINGNLRVFTFSTSLVEVPPRRGMAGVDAIVKSQPHGGTYLGQALAHIKNIPHDRLIVITDEQSHDDVVGATVDKAYMINVASYQNGVGYGSWVHIDGFSERVIQYIQELEKRPELTR